MHKHDIDFIDKYLDEKKSLKCHIWVKKQQKNIFLFKINNKKRRNIYKKINLPEKSLRKTRYLQERLT